MENQTEVTVNETVKPTPKWHGVIHALIGLYCMIQGSWIIDTQWVAGSTQLMDYLDPAMGLGIVLFGVFEIKRGGKIFGYEITWFAD